MDEFKTQIKRVEKRLVVNRVCSEIEAGAITDIFLNIVDDFRKEFRSIIYVKEPLHWLYNTGEIKQKLEALDKKWLGDEK